MIFRTRRSKLITKGASPIKTAGRSKLLTKKLPTKCRRVRLPSESYQQTNKTLMPLRCPSMVILAPNSEASIVSLNCFWLLGESREFRYPGDSFRSFKLELGTPKKTFLRKVSEVLLTGYRASPEVLDCHLVEW